jgi:3-deoxy-7-phosphoheptulonate synthase
VVAREIAGQIGGGQHGIAGVMIESFLVGGRQDLPDPSDAAEPLGLTYGQSVTDACLGWEATADVLAALARAVRDRR